MELESYSSNSTNILGSLENVLEKNVYTYLLGVCG